MMPKDVGKIRQLLDQKIEDKKEFLDRLILKDLKGDLGKHVKADELGVFKSLNQEYIK